MGNNEYIQDFTETPELDTYEYKVFREGFMKSILLSLLAQNKLTQAEYECCMEKVLRKYADTPKA